MFFSLRSLRYLSSWSSFCLINQLEYSYINPYEIFHEIFLSAPTLPNVLHYSVIQTQHSLFRVKHFNISLHRKTSSSVFSFWNMSKKFLRKTNHLLLVNNNGKWGKLCLWHLPTHNCLLIDTLFYREKEADMHIYGRSQKYLIKIVWQRRWRWFYDLLIKSN